jgi:hypothetical protein
MPKLFPCSSILSSSSSSFSMFEDENRQSEVFGTAAGQIRDREREGRRGRERLWGELFGGLGTAQILLAGAIAFSLVSCNNDKIEVYNIPKEGIAVAMQSGSEALAPSGGNPAQWTKPEGWNEQPLSEMRLGSFKVDGANAASADVSVIAFPGEAGGLISNINRWRGQLQLPPLDEDQLSQITQRTDVDDVPTYLVDFQTVENASKPSRILGAVLQTADRTWFVKMTGPPGLIESQRDKFLTFVKSFHFTNPSASEPPAPAVTTKPKSTNDQ